ncbi:(2Fe-2S)-binding protein [Flavobacterium sp. ASW18X]|uniref:(2Fe-2S)-binding protein n=1 Tax=Flavobacterium sp. ASW18X TaxID=2572595 RepID=UPI0010ADCC24|nr:(2Fe-2S)-binding protein [Flavobacterium sp. ASW18X]TKD66070.1 (2Fe-2S)-binding protein [Flavobacterium sp. ASW18X]
MPSYQINVNGASQTVEVTADTPVLWVLRDHLDLVGTKFGCGIGQCGACTIHVDGTPMRSCSLTLEQIDGKNITTIEGLSEHGEHPVQQAWKKIDVPQCGYCQAGQMMTAAAFLEKNANPTEEDIKNAMHGNICRCGSYNRIYRAVEEAAKHMG